MRDSVTIRKLFFGMGKWEGIYEESDGKHFCYNCRKMFRVGQVVIKECSPAAGRRATEYSYCHKECT